MQKTEWIWHKGSFVKWDDAQVHFLTHALHYGGAVFEGIRAYATDAGPAIFRLPEHTERLFYSASALKMEITHTRDEINAATIELIKKNELPHGYIRPLAYYDYGVMGLNPTGAPVSVSIACWPWGAYLPHEAIDVKISSYIRIHPDSTISDAKISGHYVNSMLAVLEIRGTKYHEALLCDVDGNIMEGPGENFFIVKNKKIITPKLGGILPGITRMTAMEIAKDLGFEVEERVIPKDEIFSADEAFFTGTAAEVTPIRSIDDRPLGDGKVGPVSKLIRDTYLDAVHGRNEKYKKFLTVVK